MDYNINLPPFLRAADRKVIQNSFLGFIPVLLLGFVILAVYLFGPSLIHA